MIKDPAQDATMIARLMEFKALVDDVVAKSFSSDTGTDFQFGNAVKDAFANGLSARKKKPAEMLGACYLYNSGLDPGSNTQGEWYGIFS